MQPKATEHFEDIPDEEAFLKAVLGMPSIHPEYKQRLLRPDDCAVLATREALLSKSSGGGTHSNE